MHTGKFTKIIATVGPASYSEEVIKNLILSGVNLFRFNTKHSDISWHIDVIKSVNSISDKLNVRIGTIIDLRGPELLIYTNKDKTLSISHGDRLKVIEKKEDLVENDQVFIDCQNVSKFLKVGDLLNVEDGRETLKVQSVANNNIELVVNSGELLPSGKGISVKDRKLTNESLSDYDKEVILALKSFNPDYFALSFVRDHLDPLNLKTYLKGIDCKSGVISKIEQKSALEDLDLILNESDGIMVARGDLGVDVSLEKITFYQKKIIEKCRGCFKPVIVATQMLESMTNAPTPTRAEVSDVSNAVRDGADAVMLSGETAVGKYPVETVAFMHKIVSFNEKALPAFPVQNTVKDRTYSIVEAAINIMEADKKNEISKIIVATESGRTARIFSSFRPKVPIIAVTQNIATLNSLLLSYGVFAHCMDLPDQGLAEFETVAETLKKRKILAVGEKVVVVHGPRWNDPGSTNSLYITDVS